METLSYCTVSPRANPLHSLQWVLALLPVVLLLHGFHPFAEDGGLYVAGVEYTLHPQLFPQETAFVTEHLRFSCFAPFVAALVHFTHLSLSWVLLCLYIASAALTLLAAFRICERCFPCSSAPWPGMALLAAWWTLPVAGTSLLLMDPYVTGRSFSTPFSLLAVAAALRSTQRTGHDQQISRLSRWTRSPEIASGVWIVLAALFHPLMAGYALGLVVVIGLSLRRSPAWAWFAFGACVFALAGVLQARAHPESTALTAAVHSRYYWFLAQWQWYELLGLLGPVLVFTALLRFCGPNTLTDAGRALCRASIFLASLASSITIVFAQEHFATHVVARLQPLRTYLLLYALMALLLGGVLAEAADAVARRLQTPLFKTVVRALPAAFLAGSMLGLYFADRASFPASPHFELPGRRHPNAWVQAFVWVRDHTPSNALFALDARYINTAGEDAQTFRALAQRSEIPDFSKDGGEAAITPALATEWQRGATATRDLSQLPDAQRDPLLQPFGVDWVVLHAEASTAHPCPYANTVVKVCRLR